MKKPLITNIFFGKLKNSSTFVMLINYTNQGIPDSTQIFNNGNPPLYGGTRGNDCTNYTPSV